MDEAAIPADTCSLSSENTSDINDNIFFGKEISIDEDVSFDWSFFITFCTKNIIWLIKA